VKGSLWLRVWGCEFILITQTSNPKLASNPTLPHPSTPASFLTRAETMMLSSYKAHKGMNTIIWLIQSGLGVMNAATIRIIMTAYLRVFREETGV
jgi:hypothetical protein